MVDGRKKVIVRALTRQIPNGRIADRKHRASIEAPPLPVFTDTGQQLSRPIQNAREHVGEFF